jgi:uncharacterized protein (TIGR02996 family)
VRGRRFELGARFWEAEVSYGTLRLRWGTQGGVPQSRELGLGSDALARLDEMIDARLREGFVEIMAEVADGEPAAEPPPRWWGRFERGAAYIELGLNDCTVRQRRGDTLHQELDTANRHSTREAARELVERTSKLALANGYTLVREGLPPISPGSSDPELEAQCLAEPDHVAPWAVYADWLIARSDVRGELAALHLGGKPREAEQLIHANRAVLFGVNADSWLGILELTWRHGFAAGARLHSTSTLLPDELIRELLAMPIARFIDTLTVESGDGVATLAAIGESAQAPRIRELRLHHGDFSALWTKLPALEVLHVDVGFSNLGTIEHAKLRQLVSTSGQLYETQLESLVGARLPNLEHLELGLGDVEPADTPLASLETLLASTSLPRLSHVGFTGCGYLGLLIPVLARSPIAKQLRTLDLSNGLGARRAATALATHADAFRHLESIALDGNLFNTQQLAQITKALPNVTPGTQRTREQPASKPRVRKPPRGPVMPTRRTKR